MVTPGVRCDQSRSGQAKRPRRSHGSSPPKMMSARIPFDREISAILQALGGTAHSLSPRADRFNYRRRQKSERDHMAYVAITQAFPVRDLFG